MKPGDFLIWKDMPSEGYYLIEKIHYFGPNVIVQITPIDTTIDLTRSFFYKSYLESTTVIVDPKTLTSLERLVYDIPTVPEEVSNG